MEELYIIIDGERYIAARKIRDFDGEYKFLFITEFREHWWSWKHKKFWFRYDEMNINWKTGECTLITESEKEGECWWCHNPKSRCKCDDYEGVDYNCPECGGSHKVDDCPERPTCAASMEVK